MFSGENLNKPKTNFPIQDKTKTAVYFLTGNGPNTDKSTDQRFTSKMDLIGNLPQNL